MVKLREILPIELLNSHLEEGVIRRQVHPDFSELYILNYSEQAQFNRIWDAATNVCRGLIVESRGVSLDDDEVIARGFNKFHNLNTAYVPGTMEENLPKDIPLVTTKLDGSLGILYFYADEWRVATRGSFASGQALWATAWYRKHMELCVPVWPHGASPVFEIVYPENRIVVTYDFAGLTLLGIVIHDTGAEFARRNVELWGRVNEIRVVEKFDKSLAECAAENTTNEEGYVLTYGNGLKVKVKFAEYVYLHRILTGLNPKAVWEMLAAKQNEAITTLLSNEKMPESFKKWLSGWVTQLQSRYSEIEDEAKKVFASKPGGIRKDEALYFTKTAKHLTGILFHMLDGKDYSEGIWDKVKPKATDTFKADGE